MEPTCPLGSRKPPSLIKAGQISGPAEICTPRPEHHPEHSQRTGVLGQGWEQLGPEPRSLGQASSGGAGPHCLPNECQTHRLDTQGLLPPSPASSSTNSSPSCVQALRPNPLRLPATSRKPPLIFSDQTHCCRLWCPGHLFLLHHTPSLVLIRTLTSCESRARPHISVSHSGQFRSPCA